MLQVHEEATDKRKAKTEEVASLRDEVGTPVLAPTRVRADLMSSCWLAGQGLVGQA